MSTRTVSLQYQAAEVRNVALGTKAQAETPAWKKRHGTPEGERRKEQQLANLFAAADTLDRLVEAEKRRAAKA